MSFQSYIKDFQLWCTKLGCPPEKVPKEDAIEMIFKTRQRDFICSLMKRVLPRQDVRKLRDHILISQMKRVNNQLLAPQLATRSSWPKVMQLYMKLKELKQKRLESEDRLNEYKRNYDTLAGFIRSKNVRCVELENQIKMLESKINILKLKLISLGRAINREQENIEKIATTMPVKLSASNANELLAQAAVDKAVNKLDAFYDLCMNNNNPNMLQEARDALWCKLRSTFANIPNFMLFNSIMQQKEKQLRNITTMNKLTLDDECISLEHPTSSFQLTLLATKVKLMNIASEYYEAIDNANSASEGFRHAYMDLGNKLESKMKLFQSGSHDDYEDIVSDYVVEYTMRNLSLYQNEYLSEQIELLHAEIQNNAQLTEEHELLLGSLRDMYGDINASVNRMQYEMSQLNQIKEKIIYSRNMLKCVFTDLQAANRQMYKPNLTMSMSMSLNKSKFNGSISTLSNLESFDFGNENILCSTAMDFDNSASSLNASIMPVRQANASFIPKYGGAAAEIQLPPYSMELSTFIAIPLAKFSCMSKEYHFHFSPNPLVVEPSELPTTIVQLAPGTLLTTFGALQEVQNRIMWADLIAKHSIDMKVDLNSVAVDEQQLKQRVKTQQEQITKLLSKINISAVNTKHTLEKYTQLYNFMLENKARHCIPARKLVNNRSYADYEAEYTLYYRMVTASVVHD